MKLLGSPAAVIAATAAEAEADLAEIERESEASAAELALAPPEARGGEAERRARIDAARREVVGVLAHEDWLDVREAIEAREAWVARVVALGTERLAHGGGSPTEVIFRLATEALERLPGEACEVVVSPADVADLADDLGARLARAANKQEVRIVEGDVRGGCRVRSTDGRVSFDNSFDARSRRLEPVWRAALAEIHG